jgi:hypothetical protein
MLRASINFMKKTFCSLNNGTNRLEKQYLFYDGNEIINDEIVKFMPISKNKRVRINANIKIIPKYDDNSACLIFTYSYRLPTGKGGDYPNRKHGSQTILMENIPLNKYHAYISNDIEKQSNIQEILFGIALSNLVKKDDVKKYLKQGMG